MHETETTQIQTVSLTFLVITIVFRIILNTIIVRQMFVYIYTYNIHTNAYHILVLDAMISAVRKRFEIVK